MKDDKIVVALLDTSGQVYLMMTDSDPAKIRGFNSVEEGKAHFTDAYNRNRDRGYESSMSACVHFVQFAPRIVEFDSIDQLKEYLEPEPKLFHLSGVAGGFTVLKMVDAKAVYEKGAVPALITEGVGERPPYHHKVRRNA